MEAIVKMPPKIKFIRNAMGTTLSMDALSLFPQYWAIRIAIPAAMPVTKRLSTNCTCPARDTADRDVWSTSPSIMASVALTSASIKDWMVIGSTSEMSL